MTSADFLQFNRMSPYGFDGCHYFVLHRLARPPVKSSNLPLIYLLYLQHKVRAVLDFALFGKLVRPILPYMQFLFVRPRVCYELTSYSTSRWTHLPFANSSYCQAVVDFHHQVTAHSGQTISKKQSRLRLLF